MIGFDTRTRLPHQLRRGDTLTTPEGKLLTAGPRGASIARVDHVVARPATAGEPAHFDVYYEGVEGPEYLYANNEVFIAVGVRCGNCSRKDYPVLHPTAQDVRDCFQQRYDHEFQVEEEVRAEALATRYWEEGF